MISKQELLEYSKLKGIKNIGFAERDYFQNILLFVIYQTFGNEIIFKGGTALSKCYGLDRFSEDLDFSCQKEIDFSRIKEGIVRFGLEFEVEERIFERSKSYILRIKGPLFNGNKNSFCKLVLDFSFREKIYLNPLIKNIGRFIQELPSFDVFVMDKKEIFAEKVRAIMSRDKARDVYDFCFLIDSDEKLDLELVKSKLEYYKIGFDKDKFISQIKNKRSIWDSEISVLVSAKMSFEECLSKIEKFLKESGL